MCDDVGGELIIIYEKLILKFQTKYFLNVTIKQFLHWYR